MEYKVAALYRFLPLENLPALQAEIKNSFKELGICGTLLIAPEGVNGTVAGLPDNLDKAMDLLEEKFTLSQGEVKYSVAEKKPFLRMKVRLKKEIITMKAPEANPNVVVGDYVSAEEWNDVISDPEVTLLDTRNDYETRVGIFKNALDPDIKTFTEFKDYVEKHLDPKKQKKVAMYCTGGIRCEKASAYMLAKGFEKVYHLKGGILKYLENIPEDDSLWEGECFVFDHRVGITHGLKQGDYAVCFGCREPVSPQEQKQQSYEKGVSCPHCINDLSQERIDALRMRHKYMTANIQQQKAQEEKKNQA